jgi:V/A-type H+/Na+-transporting ATPase subunit E
VGLEEIVGRISQEAADQAGKVLADAGAEATRIVSDAKAKADALVSGAKAQAEREVREERMRSVASARLAAKREILQAREDVIQRYEAGVMGAVDDFAKSDGYSKFLVSMIEDGLSKIGKDAKIQVNGRDRALLKGKKLGGEVSKDELDCKGGAMVSSSDGKKRVDNTIESLLRDRSDVIRLKLLDQVFADGSKKNSP